MLIRTKQSSLKPYTDKQQKQTHQVVSIYIFVRTHTYMCILLHTVIINKKEAINLRLGGTWERLEGGRLGEAGERKGKAGSDVISSN